MTKKFLSMFLALAMCLSLAAPAFAETPANDEPEYDEVVVFSDAASEDGIQLLSDLSNNERIQQAKDGVLALELDEIGLGYIEEACLAELDKYAQKGNIVLEEYTVFVPKARASQPVFLATYGGYDIYSYFTSRGIYTTTKTMYDSDTDMGKWRKGLIDLAMCFVSSPVVSLQWTVVSSIHGAPSDHQTYVGDWVECYARIYPTNRAFYVKEGDSFRNVYNREFGRVYPYTEYYYQNPSDASHPFDLVTMDSEVYSDINDSNRDAILGIVSGLASAPGIKVNHTIEQDVLFKWVTAK